MKTRLKTCIFLSLIFMCSAFNGDYTLINSISFPQPILLTTDKLGNAFVVVENQLLQFDLSGKPLGNYSESNLGQLWYVDPSNPMKIVLFYLDFAKLIVLDTKLTVQSTVDLRSININQPLTACRSEDDGYWVYDREDDQLKQIDLNLQVVHQSGNLTQILGYQVQPGMMIQDNGLVYINNPESGIIVFDRFASYYKTIPYTKLLSFQVVNKDILFIKNNKLLRYDSKTFDEKEVLLPDYKTIRAARIEQHQLYLLTSDSLNFYSF